MPAQELFSGPIIIRTVPTRTAFIEYMTKRIPSAATALDTQRNALANFVAACRMAGDGPALHMEDDVILTEGFMEKVSAEIAKRPRKVIQFFSMRKADITIGSREELGRTFLMAQCFYLPDGISKGIAEYSERWPGKAKNPTGLDNMVADYLQATKRKYWIHVPSLVQHRKCKSEIDKRRSSGRRSQTFRIK